MRRWLAYGLFTIGGRLLPAEERARLLRVLRTGDPEDRVPVAAVVLPTPGPDRLSGLPPKEDQHA